MGGDGTGGILTEEAAIQSGYGEGQDLTMLPSSPRAVPTSAPRRESGYCREGEGKHVVRGKHSRVNTFWILQRITWIIHNSAPFPQHTPQISR